MKSEPTAVRNERARCLRILRELRRDLQEHGVLADRNLSFSVATAEVWMRHPEWQPVESSVWSNRCDGKGERP